MKNVKFNDTNLEEEIRIAIGKPEGEILIEDMEQIKSLHIGFSEIKSLQGLQHCKNLIEIDACDNEITDLTPLTELEKLKKINFESNKINFVPDFKAESISGLILRDNLIEKINLKRTKEILLLVLKNNKLKDISSLSGINIKNLDIEGNDIKKIPLLINLERLYLDEKVGEKNKETLVLIDPKTNLNMEEIREKTDLHYPVEIELTKVTGEFEDCFKVSVDNFRSANKMLNLWRKGNDNYSSDVDFKILFSNEDTYNGTYELYKYKSQFEGLRERIISFIETATGLKKPNNITKENYEAYLSMFSKRTKKDYEEFLTDHLI